MAVAFDAVGPAGGAGKASTSSKTITWTHTSVGTSGLAGIVAVAQDASSATNAAYTCTVTWGGVAMTSLGRVASQNTPQYGYIQLFGLISPPNGAQTITVTCSGTPPHLIGSSLSVTGAGSFGPAVTEFGGSATASVSVAGTSANNMLVGAFCAGQPFGATPTSPLVKRALDNVDTTNGAGNFALGTAPGVVGSQALSWPLTDNAWGAVGVEVVAAPANPPLSSLVTDFTAMPAFFDGDFGGAFIDAQGRGNVPTVYGYAAFATNIANQPYSFVGDTLFVQVPQVSGTSASLQNSVMVSVDGNNSIEMGMDGGTFKGRITRATVTTDTLLAGGVYDAVAHAWWRVRESGGTVYWDTSPDGTTWTNRGSAVHQLTLTAVSLKLQAGHWNQADADGVNAIYDNLNTVPAPPVAPWHAVLDGTYTTNVAAGFEDDNWNRDDGSGGYGTLPWPINLVAAPGQRPGQAVPYVMPAGYKRHESVAAAPYFEDGDFAYFGDAFYLDTGFPIDGYGGGWQTITQLRQADDTGSPGMSLEVSGGVLKATGGYGVTGANPVDEYAYSVTLLDGITTQTWYDVVWSLNFSATPGGSVLNVWVDGTQVLTDYTIPSPTVQDTADGQGTYWKSGLYRDPTGAPAATIYHAGTAFGPTYADADPYLAPVVTIYQGAASATVAVSGTAAAVRETPIPSSPPAGTDALQARTLDEVRTWEDWLAANGATGYVGEFAVVSLYGTTTGVPDWIKLLELYLEELDYAGLHGTVWASGRNWGSGYPLGVEVGTNPGDPLSISNATVPTVGDHPSRNQRRHGVNLSGWESGVATGGGGTVRSSAGYPPGPEDFAFIAGDGIDTVRLPLAWERMQPTLGQPLDATALATLDGLLTAAHDNGIAVILDLHNYGRFTDATGTVHVLGDTLAASDLSDFWTQMVQWLAADPGRLGTVVAVGIQNEPHDMPGGLATWQSVSQAVVTAIRDAGYTRLISVAGYNWSHLESWVDTHGETGWITDPAGSFVYEAHHYWDTATDPSVGGPRSGQYQESDGAGGVRVETYATELAAAEQHAADVGVIAVAVTGTATPTQGMAAVAPGTVAVSGSADAVRVSIDPVLNASTIDVTGTAQVWQTLAAAARGVVAVSAEPVAPTHWGAAVGAVDVAGAADCYQVHLGVDVDPGVVDVFGSASAVDLPALGGAAVIEITASVDANQTFAGTSAAGAVADDGTAAANVDHRGTSTTPATVEITTDTWAELGRGETVSAVVAITATATANDRAWVTATADVATFGESALGPIPGGYIPVTVPVTGTAQVWATLEAAAVGVDAAGGIIGTQVAAGNVPVTVAGVAVASVGHGSAVAVTVAVTGHAIVARGLMSVAAATVEVTGAADSVIATQAAVGAVAVGVRGFADAVKITPVFPEPAGPLVRQVPTPVMRLLVADTVTGRIGWELPFTDLSWNSPLNKNGTVSATIPIESTIEAIYAQGAADPVTALRETLTGPKRLSYVVCYGQIAVWAGPMQPSLDVTSDTPSVQVAGSELESLLADRILIGTGPGTSGTLSDPSRDVAFYSTNPAGAIYHIVGHAITNWQPGDNRSLPIYCSNPPDLRGEETFTYLAYDLTTADKAISDLVGRDDGPDVRLAPFLLEGSDALYVYWDLQIGDPYLPSTALPGPNGPLPWTFDDSTAIVTRSTDGTGMGSVYYVAGSGQDRNKLIGSAASTDLTQLGFPTLEEVDTSQNSQTDQWKLDQYAAGLVTAHESPTETWTAKLHADSYPPLGTYRAGDLARFEISRHWLIEPGVYLRRITEVAGAQDNTVTVTCAPAEANATVGV